MFTQDVTNILIKYQLTKIEMLLKMTYNLNNMLTYDKSLFQSLMVEQNCQLNSNIICWIYLLLCIKMLFRVVVIGMTYCIVCSCFFHFAKARRGVNIYLLYRLNVPCRKYKGMFLNDLTSRGSFWIFWGIIIHFKSKTRLL